MDEYFDLNQRTYDWCARAFEQARKVLGVCIKMHHAQRQIDSGEIFLFNHFARMETFIPQYLIYQETGAFCRSIASASFFARKDRFSEILRDLGVVPNNHPQLMELLARDILRGRKVVVFPEGGMVKDRQVVDERGHFSVYSRHAKARRKHHTGAARLATGLQIFKHAVQYRAERDDHATLTRWAEEIGVAGPDALLDAARRAVVLVPANITFYPLRVSDNILRRGAEMLTGGLSKRAVDELVVEGNILLKATDMDINLGRSIEVEQEYRWLDQALLGYLARGLPNLGAIFDINYLNRALVRRVATRSSHTAINRLRDRYMREIYRSATVNLSHLASSIILTLAEQGQHEIAGQRFRETLYLAVKHLHNHREIRLHRGLVDPTLYRAVLTGVPSALTEFLDSAQSVGLIEHDAVEVRFKDKLVKEHGFDEIRLENPIEVYANEVEPLQPVGLAVRSALTRATTLTRRELAHEWFDDEAKTLAWDRALYTKRDHHDINTRETATADPSPFLFEPAQARALGVVLVHGFLASPAEVRDFGTKLAALGYTTLGLRIKGHGTSPWDLRERSWRDWLASVEQGRALMSALVEHYVVVGFSTGGTLSLISAAEQPQGIAGVVALGAPIKFRNKNLRFVPIMHGANRIVRWISSYEGVMPFRPNESEHPHINYRHMPLRGLYELTRVANHLNGVLRDVRCPVCLVQASDDRVVDPESASIAYKKLGTGDKELHWIESNRHGILNEDIGETHGHVLDFVRRMEATVGIETDVGARLLAI